MMQKVALVTGSGKKRVGWHVAAQRLQPLDLAIDADDVRIPFAGQLEGRDRPRRVGPYPW